MDLKLKSERINAVFFLLISVSAGGIFYLFQLVAARQLSTEEFGNFSAWMAWVGIGLSVAAFAQYSANFFPVQKKGLRASMGFAMLMSFFVVMAFCFSHRIHTTLIGVLAIVIAPFITWLLGQAQRRMLLMTYAFGGFIIGAFKLVFVFLPLESPETGIGYLFYWALPISYCAGAVFLAFILFRQMHRSPIAFQKADENISVRLTGALLLSVVSVFIPNIDLVYVKFTQDADSLTNFAQVSLFYKVVFFVILIVAQWLLPRQLNRAATTEVPKGKMKMFGRICTMGLMFALCASVIAPHFYQIVLGKEFTAPMIWVFMSCFNVALLTGIFLELQDQISALKVRDAAVCLVIQILGVLTMGFLDLDLAVYLQAQIAINGMLLFLLMLGAGGILARQVTD